MRDIANPYIHVCTRLKTHTHVHSKRMIIHTFVYSYTVPTLRCARCNRPSVAPASGGAPYAGRTATMRTAALHVLAEATSENILVWLGTPAFELAGLVARAARALQLHDMHFPGRWQSCSHILKCVPTRKHGVLLLCLALLASASLAHVLTGDGNVGKRPLVAQSIGL